MSGIFGRGTRRKNRRSDYNVNYQGGLYNNNPISNTGSIDGVPSMVSNGFSSMGPSNVVYTPQVDHNIYQQVPVKNVVQQQVIPTVSVPENNQFDAPYQVNFPNQQVESFAVPQVGYGPVIRSHAPVNNCAPVYRTVPVISRPVIETVKYPRTVPVIDSRSEIIDTDYVERHGYSDAGGKILTRQIFDKIDDIENILKYNEAKIREQKKIISENKLAGDQIKSQLDRFIYETKRNNNQIKNQIKTKFNECSSKNGFFQTHHYRNSHKDKFQSYSNLHHSNLHPDYMDVPYIPYGGQYPPPTMLPLETFAPVPPIISNPSEMFAPQGGFVAAPPPMPASVMPPPPPPIQSNGQIVDHPPQQPYSPMQPVFPQQPGQYDSLYNFESTVMPPSAMDENVPAQYVDNRIPSNEESYPQAPVNNVPFTDRDKPFLGYVEDPSQWQK